MSLFSLSSASPKRIIQVVLGVVLIGILLGVLSGVIPSNLRGALFQKNPAITPPLTGIFISRAYQANPNERGAVLLEAGENLLNFEALSLTIVTDPLRAKFLQVRRTAVTQNFEISTNFLSPGVLRVALVGTPRQVNRGQALLEIEMQLADRTVNTTNGRIDIRLLSPSILVEGSRTLTLAHDGLITITSVQNALTLPFSPFIADIEPAVFPLVQHRSLTIRGQALPASPRVLLGNRPIPVLSASPTQITAMIPEDMPQGLYTLSVESLLADEKVLIFDAPGPSGSIDILEDLLFFSPNPVLFNTAQTAPGVVLWIPVHNPLGASDSINGSVDLSRIGGDPNVTFSGVGTPAVGPGGVTVNWFRVPATGTFPLPKTLDTNVDYPVTVRVENRNRTRDQATELLSLRSQIPQGTSPFFGRVESVPAAPLAGDDVTFFADITDNDGVDSVQVASVRLTSIRGGVQNLEPAFDIPTGNVPLATMTFSTEFTLPKNLTPGTYLLDFVARDDDGNEGQFTFPFIVSAPGGAPIGSAPVFSGRLEARPLRVRPGGDLDLFAAVQDPDGTSTIKLVSIDLIPIGGGVVEMEPSLDSSVIGTLPLTYEASFKVPTTIPGGNYVLPVTAVDENGRSASATIPVIVDTTSAGAGTPPQFSGRLEASPTVVPLSGDVSFFVGVQDLDGTDTLSQVVIDLVSIGGSILELEPAVDPVKDSTQPVVYTGEFTLPGSVKAGAYSLEVRAIDEDGNLAKTTLPLTVSAVTQQGSPPVIAQVFSTPNVVPADNRTEVFFTAEVEDGDGIQDIESVSINLSPLRLGIEFLDLQSDSGGGRKGVFTSSKFKIPTTVTNGSYDLTLEIEDKQGNIVRRTLRLTIGRAATGGIPSFRENRFVPAIVRPDEKTKLYVEVLDENGADTVTVVADFTDIRGSVETLNALIKFPTGTVATQNTFASKDIAIPEDLPQGVYDVPLTAIDTSGNTVTGSARLRVERSGADQGQLPHILPDRAFQTPRIFINDDETEGEIHVLVNDADDDVLTVIANIGTLGTAESASGRDNIGDIELLCNESRALVCMEPGVPEGLTGRWFILKDIVIPPTTLPSTEPYYVEFTAMDAKGHTDKVTIPVYVGGPDTETILRESPTFLAVVPVDEDELEILLSAPIKTDLVSRTGNQFIIRPTLNALSELKVRSVSWDTTGRLLYVQTDPLNPGETYTFSIAAPGNANITPLTDVYGNRFSRDQGGSLAFTAFKRTGEIPKIESVKLVDSSHIDVHFTVPVLPSSVHTDILPARALLRSMTTGEQKLVKGGTLQDQARVLRLTVEPLREGERYLLRIAGVLTSGPVEAPPPGAEKSFVALLPREGEEEAFIILPTADLNADGKVDFADFALFSAVYGTEYDPEEARDLPPPGFVSGGRSDSRTDSTRNAAPPEDSFGGDLPSLQY